MTHTAAQIIDSKGGSIAVAAALGVKPARVRMWKLRQSLPRSVWPELMEAFPDLTMDDLRRAEAA